MSFFSNYLGKALGLAVTTILLLYAWVGSDYASSFRLNAKQALLNELTSQNLLPVNKKVDVIYILGGGEDSQRYKYRTAEKLYQQGVTDRVWLFSRDESVENNYSDESNIQNKAWGLRLLKRFDIPQEKVELMPVKEGLFGTYSEARDITTALLDHQYKSILLISSPYHTRRLKESFQFFAKDQGVDLYVMASEEEVYLRDMLTEYFKLKVYELTLLV